MNGFARAPKIEWLNKCVTDNQRVALAASALLLCLFANIVDPVTTEDNKIFFSLTVELLGFFSSISLITLGVNALRKNRFKQERDLPVKLFVVGLSTWILYCLVGIYSNTHMISEDIEGRDYLRAALITKFLDKRISTFK